MSCVKNGSYTEYNKFSSSLYTYAREDETQKLLVVCSYTEKEVAFKAPEGFDPASARLLLQNYPNPGDTMKPYEVRVYLWNK